MVNIDKSCTNSHSKKILFYDTFCSIIYTLNSIKQNRVVQILVLNTNTGFHFLLQKMKTCTILQKLPKHKRIGYFLELKWFERLNRFIFLWFFWSLLFCLFILLNESVTNCLFLSVPYRKNNLNTFKNTSYETSLIFVVLSISTCPQTR